MKDRDMNQNPNPQETDNNVFEQNEGQSFARRTVSWAFNLGLIVLAMGIFAGWYFSTSDEPDGAADTQMPGNQYAEDSLRGGLYDFFYGIFSGFGDGDDDPLQTPAVQDVPAMPVNDVSGAGGDADGSVAVQDAIVVPSVNERSAQSGKVSAVNITPETAPSYFDGKIIDYQGNVAGDIKAMIRNENGERIIYFELVRSLTPADKPRNYRIAYDEVDIAEEGGAEFIRLNKEQTEALAKTLYKSEEDQPETQSPERE